MATRTDREELDAYRLITPPWLYEALFHKYRAEHDGESPYVAVKRIHRAMKRK